jgi:hypothetical protein
VVGQETSPLEDEMLRSGYPSLPSYEKEMDMRQGGEAPNKIGNRTWLLPKRLIVGEESP